MLSFSVIGRSTLQGLPTATTPEGISFVTTLPAPMTVLEPMVTLILNGEPEEYLRNAAGSHGLED